MGRNFTPCLAHGVVFCHICWPDKDTSQPKFEDQTGHVTPSIDLPNIRRTITMDEINATWPNGPAEVLRSKSCSADLAEENYRRRRANQPTIEEEKEIRLQEHRAAILAEPHKQIPLHGGCFAYFGDALMAVAELSALANEKHNPGQPLGWTKGHSNKHLDSAARHMLKAGQFDSEWLPKKVRHSTLLAWRALANLQIEIENERLADTNGSAVR